MEGYWSRNTAKRNLSSKKSSETLHVPLQRGPDGQSMQFYDHDQYFRVNHLSGPDIGLISYNVCPTTFLQTSYNNLVLQSAKQMHESEMAHLF